MPKFYRTGSHSKHDLKVHLIWIPKYRRKILTGQIGEATRELIRQICNQLDIRIISGKVAPDHVHLFVSYPPPLSISNMMQKIKGKSAYKLFQRFPDLRKQFYGCHLWARGYCAVSSGNITDEMVEEYIKNQEGEVIHGDLA
jgi:putative transposase